MRQRLLLMLRPLSLSALLTWLAVLLSLRGEAGGATPLRLCLMLAFLAGFLLGDQPGLRRRTQDLLLWLQLFAALGMLAAAPRTGTAAILLVILAAEMAMLWRPLSVLLVLGAANLIFFWLLARSAHPAPWLIATAYVGFQSFAALTGHYARSAERARDQLALVNADLLATRALLADSARDAERLRVARELHDVAGHKLTAMKLNLRALAADPALAGHPQVGLGERLASELLDDIRNVVQALRDSRGLDLQTALRALAAPLPQLRMDLHIDDGIRVHDPALAEALLRIVQEALTNAARHAGATRLRVDLGRQGQRLWLHVEDDGQAPPQLREGNGLAGIRERVAGAGGELVLDRNPAGSLTLDASFPL